MSLRAEKKAETRRSLLDSTYALTRTGRCFSTLSLREVTRHAGVVPTAFYRHFRSLEDLGLTLVEEVCDNLRNLMTALRDSASKTHALAERSVHTFLEFIDANEATMRFLVRERAGGSEPIRKAIAQTIQRSSNELASELRNVPAYAHLSDDEIDALARLLVNTVITVASEALDAIPSAPSRASLAERATWQMRVILVGARYWRSGTAPAA